MSDALLSAVIAAVPATIITIINFFMLRASRQALDAQTQLTRAQFFSRLRDKWTELDKLMIENVQYFQEVADQPAAPLVLPNGQPNTDRRLYISLIFFGMVEEILTLRERGFAEESDLDSYAGTIATIMTMPAAREFWKLTRDAYPPHVQAYLDPLAATPDACADDLLSRASA